MSILTLKHGTNSKLMENILNKGVIPLVQSTSGRIDPYDVIGLTVNPYDAITDGISTIYEINGDVKQITPSKYQVDNEINYPIVLNIEFDTNDTNLIVPNLYLDYIYVDKNTFEIIYKLDSLFENDENGNRQFLFSDETIPDEIQTNEMYISLRDLYNYNVNEFNKILNSISKIDVLNGTESLDYKVDIPITMIKSIDFYYDLNSYISITNISIDEFKKIFETVKTY